MVAFLFSCVAKFTLKKLSVVQNNCIRIATGALKGSCIKSLEVEANIPPLNLHFEKINLRLAASILEHKHHPIRWVIEDFYKYTTYTHPHLVLGLI